MNGFRNLSAALAVRWHELRRADGRDRGEGPVSTAIIVAIIALAAVAVAGIIYGIATTWTEEIPTDLPDLS